MPLPIGMKYINERWEEEEHYFPNEKEVAQLLRDKTKTEGDMEKLLYGRVLKDGKNKSKPINFNVSPEWSDEEVVERYMEKMEREMKEERRKEARREIEAKLRGIQEEAINYKERIERKRKKSSLNKKWNKLSKIILLINILWILIIGGLGLWQGAEMFGYYKWEDVAIKNFCWTLMYPLVIVDVGTYIYERYVKG